MPGLLARLFGFGEGETSPVKSHRVEPSEARPVTEPGEPTIQSVAIPVHLPSRGPYRSGHEVPYYPGRGKAVYADPVDDLIRTQLDLIDRVKQASALSYDDFDTYILPVIHRYAEYVHLLPASEMDHHADLGGLFRHGLEVAFHASRRCEGKEFGLNEVPSVRKYQFFRWRACALIGGLLHDLGKAVIDVGAVDESGTLTWNPHVQPLYEWTQEHNLTHYFVTWNPNRVHRQHDVISATALDRIVPVETKRWLGEYRGRVPYDAMLMALARTQNSGHNPLMEIIHGADMASVDIDLKETAKRMAAIGEGGLRSLGAKFLRTIREKLNNGDWKINEPGQPIWYTTEGLLAMYPIVAKEIIEALRAKGETSIPVDAPKVLQILTDSGLVATFLNSEGSTYNVLKFSLQASRKSGTDVPVSGTAFKFVNELAVPEYYVMPTPIPVTIYDPTGVKMGYGGIVEEGTQGRTDAANAGSSTQQQTGAAPAAPAAAEPRGPAPGASETAPDHATEIVFGEDDPDQDGIIDAEQDPDVTAEENEAAGDPAIRDWANEPDARNAVIDHGRAQSAATFPPTTMNDAALWIAEEEVCGPIASLLVERINMGELRPNEHYFDVDGCLHFLHNHQMNPGDEELYSTLDGMGADPSAIFQRFKENGWIEPSPGQENLIVPYRYKGSIKKCIRFTYDHSAVFMLLTGSYRTEKPPAPLIGVGPFINEDTAKKIQSTTDAVPSDGPIFRAAYHDYLNHLVAETSLEWHERKYLLSDMTTFAKQHDLLEPFLRSHLQDKLLLGKAGALYYNPEYDPIVDEVEAGDAGDEA